MQRKHLPLQQLRLHQPKHQNLRNLLKLLSLQKLSLQRLSRELSKNL